MGWAAGPRGTGVTGRPGVRDRLRPGRRGGLLRAGHRVDPGRRETLLEAAEVGPGRSAVVRDVIPGHAAVAGAVRGRGTAASTRAPVAVRPAAPGGPAA